MDDNSDNSNQEHHDNHNDDCCCCLGSVILAAAFIHVCRHLCNISHSSNCIQCTSRTSRHYKSVRYKQCSFVTSVLSAAPALRLASAEKCKNIGSRNGINVPVHSTYVQSFNFRTRSIAHPVISLTRKALLSNHSRSLNLPPN